MTEVENYTDDFFYDGDERTIGKNDYCNFMIEGSDFFLVKKSVSHYQMDIIQ